MKKASRLAGAVLALSLVLPVSVGAETWVIDPAHTVSGFTVKHMMIANVTGVFEVTRGTIEYRPGDPGSVKADITIEAKSVNTRIGRRDDDLRSDNFFSIEKFPTLAFRSRRVQNVRAEGFDLVGDLTIRDVTREVALEVEFGGRATDPWGNQRAGFVAKASIDRKDFGLRWNQVLEAGGVLVGDRVGIELEVEAVKAAAAKAA